MQADYIIDGNMVLYPSRKSSTFEMVTAYNYRAQLINNRKQLTLQMSREAFFYSEMWTENNLQIMADLKGQDKS